MPSENIVTIHIELAANQISLPNSQTAPLALLEIFRIQLTAICLSIVQMAIDQFNAACICTTLTLTSRDAWSEEDALMETTEVRVAELQLVIKSQLEL